MVITVTDDGAGIDPAALRRTALARGLAHGQAALGAMDDAAALDLVFMPGFSTAAAVTDVSGPRRGHGCRPRRRCGRWAARCAIAGARGVRHHRCG